jgi:hypothetical protein
MCTYDQPKEYGHRPVSVTFNIMVTSEGASQTCDDETNTSSRIAWHKVNSQHINQYQNRVRRLLQNRAVCNMSNGCMDMNCQDKNHVQCIETACTDLIKICLQAGDAVFPKCQKRNPLSPKWNTQVKPYRDDSLFWGALWTECGKPSTGVVHDIYKKTKRAYHYAIRNHKKQVCDLRNVKMAEAICNQSQRNLWSELRKVRGKHKLCPPNVDGYITSDDICSVFLEKYKHLYNSVPSDSLEDCIADIESSVANSDSKNFVVDVQTIQQCINQLKSQKYDGDRGLWSDHLIWAPPEFIDHLCCMFTDMIIHGYTPSPLLLSTVIPLIKDKSQDICPSANFRGIALCCSISKLFDLYILRKYADKFTTSDLQFAYKAGHSTTMCTSVLKEVVSYYRSNGSEVYCALLDASKAFDRVRFDRMVDLLKSRDVPSPIIRILLDIFMHQRLRVSWKGTVSEEFMCVNGVRQGGVASPILFAVYFDQLLQYLSKCGAGCHMGHFFVGAVAYADDITILAPTVKGLQIMLATCENFAKEYSVIFNEKKSICIHFNLRNCSTSVPEVFLNDNILMWSNKVTHLGNVITSDLKDAEDIKVKVSDFIHRVNSIVVNFRSASCLVKTKLFDTQCFFYGSQQWCLYDVKNIEYFHVQWRKAVRRLWGLPWHARSAVLHQLLNKQPFIDQLCHRFLKMVNGIRNGSNETVKFIVTMSSDFKGPVQRNLKYCCDHWTCNESELNRHRDSPSQISRDQANLIKELVCAKEGDMDIAGFTSTDISDLIYLISTC